MTSTENKQPQLWKSLDGTFMWLAPVDTDTEFIKINEEDLLNDPAVDKGQPLQKPDHFSLLLGIPENFSTGTHLTAEVFMNKQKPFDVHLSELGFFTNDKVFEDGSKHQWDVLWAKPDEESEGKLRALQEILTKIYNVPWHHPDGYHPHLTLAYLKHGTAEKYVTKGGFEVTLRVDKVHFKKHRSQVIIDDILLQGEDDA
jgi:hypothetical protein